MMVRLMYLVGLTIYNMTDEDGTVGEDELIAMVGWFLLLMVVVGSVMVMVE